MSEETPRHLVLVGLMGAGKSTVGEACAERLGRSFVDTDELVEATTGRTIAEIFDQAGEPAFRELERSAIRDVCASPEPLVIACGGGAVVDAENRKALRARGFVVWLRAVPAVLAERVRGTDDTRPLLRGDAERQLDHLADMRAGAYQSAAHATIDTDHRSIDDVVDAVLEEQTRCSV